MTLFEARSQDIPDITTWKGPVSIRQAMRILMCGREAITKRMESGEIQAVKMGRYWNLRATDVARLAGLGTTPVPAAATARS